jgi:hypothetical protein
LIGDANFTQKPNIEDISTAIAVRSDGVVVVSAAWTPNSGVDREIRCFTRSIAGVWTNRGNLFSSVRHQGCISIGPSSDDMVSFAASDAEGDDLDMNTISSGNTIGTVQQIDATIDTGFFLVGAGFIDKDDQLYVPYVDSTDDVSVADWTSGATPTFTITTAASDRDVAYSGATTTPFPQLVLAGRDNGDRQLLYVDVTDTDIRRNEDTGSGYGADESVTPTITATHLSGNMYDDLLMWFYKSGTLAYDEDTQTAETAYTNITSASTTNPDNIYYLGPFLISSAMYVPLCRNGNDIIMFKSTSDPPADANFTQTGGRAIISNDDGHNRYVQSMWAFEHNNDIYVLAQTKAGRISFSIYDVGTDTWTTENQTVAIPTDISATAEPPSRYGVSAHCRSDGDVVCVFGYSDGTNDRLRVYVRTGTTWTDEGAADAGVASTDYINPIVFPPDSSDRITWAYKDSTNNDLDLKSISSTDVVATNTEIDAAVSVTFEVAGRGAISSDIIYLPYIDSTGDLSVASWTSGAAPTPSIATGVSDATVVGYANCLAVRANGDRYVMWRGTDSDLYRDVDTGSGFGTDVEEIDAITVTGTPALSCRVNEPAAIDLDYVYRDGATWHFGTHEIDAGGPADPGPKVNSLMLTGLGI